MQAPRYEFDEKTGMYLIRFPEKDPAETIVIWFGVLSFMALVATLTWALLH